MVTHIIYASATRSELPEANVNEENVKQNTNKHTDKRKLKWYAETLKICIV